MLNQVQNCVSNKEFAREYAKLGWKVFPLHYIRDGKCSCGKDDCRSPGKHPRTINGLKDATTDLEQIELWWTETPQANIGIVTGEESGLVVVDVDRRHGGLESFARLQQENQRLPEPQVTTGGGGHHLYLATTEGVEVKNTTNLGGFSGIDIRGEGGYVVAPPSSHELGVSYKLNVLLENLKDSIQPAPQWLIELIAKRKSPSGNATDNNRPTGLGWVAEALKNLKDGNRNDTVARVAGKLINGGFSDEEIIAILKPHAEKVSMSADEFEKEVIGLCRRYPKDTSTSQFSYSNSVGVEVFDPVHIADRPEPPPQDFILGNLIPKGHTSLVYGDGGACKTTLAMILSACVSMGKDFGGMTTKQGAVIYLDWELNEEDFLRRAYKVARGFDLSALPPNIFYVSVCQPVSHMIDKIRALALTTKATLIIVDSMGLAAGTDPESAKHVIPLFQQIRALGMTVLIIDHQSKMQEGQSYDKKSPFGSVYKYNLARSVAQLRKTQAVGDDVYLLFNPTKNNFSSINKALPLKLSFSDNAVKLQRDDLSEASPNWQFMTSSRKITEALAIRGPSTANELAEYFGDDIKRGTITNVLGDLKRLGHVVEDGKKGNAPIYKLPKTDADEKEAA